MKILVAYATKNGSTTDVAQAIGVRLREYGCSVEIKPAKIVKSLQEFDFLVIGAPIYSGQWHNGAHRILKRIHKLKSEQTPDLALFALGPRKNEGPEDWVRPNAQFERAIKKHPSVNPVSKALFGGADPPKKSVRRDIRDWEAIKAWADELAKIIGCKTQ
jgi:menaquinone-dependent protoporphyrinogen oxidase